MRGALLACHTSLITIHQSTPMSDRPSSTRVTIHAAFASRVSLALCLDLHPSPYLQRGCLVLSCIALSCLELPCPTYTVPDKSNSHQHPTSVENLSSRQPQATPSYLKYLSESHYPTTSRVRTAVNRLPRSLTFGLAPKRRTPQNHM